MSLVDPAQNDEVIETPVQDGRRLEQRELVQLAPDRPRRKSQDVGDRYEALQAASTQRNRKAAAQLRQRFPAAMSRRHHREAGQAAFRRLGLQDKCFTERMLQRRPF
ncbi:hypothetical protein D3C73_1388110 [compost metagenome]